MSENDSDQSNRSDTSWYRRREALELAGGTIAASIGLGLLDAGSARSKEDEADDGIPTSLKRSDSFHRYLENTFGADQFDGLHPGHEELIVDARYVGGTGISNEAKERIEELFLNNGIHLHWLDYPRRYDQDRFEAEYGYNGEKILWPVGSFYQDEIESELKNVAVQLVVVPNAEEAGTSKHIHATVQTLSSTEDGKIAGLSFGNRAIVTEQSSVEHEVALNLHEIAHLGVCHDDDEDNTGIMGPTRDEIDLMEREWEQLRNSLDNVRDTSGFDIILRPCIWEEYFDDVIVGDECEC